MKKYVVPHWEVITQNLLHDMAQQYMLQGMKIPQNIIVKLSLYEMSLGNAAHKNYAIIDDWVSEALHQLQLPAIVAGGFAAQRLNVNSNINHEESPNVSHQSTNHNEPIEMDEQPRPGAPALPPDAISFEEALDHVLEGLPAELDNLGK